MQRVARNETRFVGLDVHTETIAVAIAAKDGDVHAMGSISNRPESIKRLVLKLDAGADAGGIVSRQTGGMLSGWLVAVGPES
jgi:transposase